MQRTQEDASSRELTQAPERTVFSYTTRLNMLPSPARMAVAVVVMLALIATVVATGAPNPNMILVTGLVVCSALLGYAGGVTAALMMFGYTLYFFSERHDWLSFTDVNLQKVIISTTGIVIVTFFVCSLKRAEAEALASLERAMEKLKRDNALLAEASGVDTLTGLRNRFALRRDYDQYAERNEPQCVAMIDLDNFKEINDNHGHECGDYVLSRTGVALLDVFGAEHSYRYGGDEFLLILPDGNQASFRHNMLEVMERLRTLRLGDQELNVHLSAGYVVGTPQLPSDLRHMFRQADAHLYAAKDNGKDRIEGGLFDRAAARVAEEELLQSA